MQGRARKEPSPSTWSFTGHSWPSNGLCGCEHTREGVAEGNTKNLANELKPILPTSKVMLTLWVVWD